MEAKIKLLLITTVLVLTSLACEITIGGDGEKIFGRGEVITQTRPVSDIHSVRLTNQGDLYIDIGDEDSLVVEAQENIIDYLTTDVSGGRLTLGTAPTMNLMEIKPIKYYLTVKSLDEINVSSSGNVHAPALSSDSFRIYVNSSGDVMVDELWAQNLEVGISSSGDVIIDSGDVQDLTLQISSSGDFSASGLDSQRANVNVSSSGNANMQVSEQLNATLTSSGNVYFSGDPMIDTRETSSGKVVKRGH